MRACFFKVLEGRRRESIFKLLSLRQDIAKQSLFYKKMSFERYAVLITGFREAADFFRKYVWLNAIQSIELLVQRNTIYSVFLEWAMQSFALSS